MVHHATPGTLHMDLTLSAAAKALGKSKSTLSRAIKRGQVSARQDQNGVYHIDAAELVRVYGWNGDAAPQWSTTPPPEVPLERPPEGTRVALLEMRVEMLQALLDREREATAELRQVLSLLPLQTRSQEAVPVVPTAPEPPKVSKGFLARLLGR